MKKIAFLMLALIVLGSASALACGMKDHSESAEGEQAEQVEEA